MRSVRIDDQLDERVQRAAAREGVTASGFIRAAVADRHCRNSARSPSSSWPIEQ